jgi:hypothetical protein
MGEAKRREAYDTLDGGPPSDAPMVMSLDFFEPFDAILGQDRIRWQAVREAGIRSRRRPTPICGACDYEFALGEAGQLLYAVRPFMPKADSYQIIGGAICRRCAALPPEEMTGAVVGHLRAILPNVELAASGKA